MKVLSLPSYLRKLYTHWKVLQIVKKEYHNGNWQSCISHCNELIESIDTDFFGYYYRGLSYAKIKFFQEAMLDLESAKANLRKNKFPTLMKEYHPDVDLRIVNICRLQRKYDVALTKLKLLLHEHPNYIYGYKEMAGIYIDMNNLTFALDSINEGLRLKPNDKELQEFQQFLIYDLSTTKES